MGANHARIPRKVMTQVSALAGTGVAVVLGALAIEQRATLWSAVPAAVTIGLLAGLLVTRFRSVPPSPEPVTPRSVRDYYLVPTELPPGPDVFVGRWDELQAMTGFVQSARTTDADGHAPSILLTGRPGIGKTATALHFAYRVDTRYRDGQLFGRRDMTVPGGGWEAVLRAFVGALLGPGDDRPTDRSVLASEFARLTRDRRVLVVLDDVSQDDDITGLLPSGPSSLAVVTSRDDLPGRPDDLRIELMPLAQATSVELLGTLLGPGDDRVARATDAAGAIVDGAGNVPLGVTLSGTTLAGRPHWDLQLVVRRLRQRSADNGDALDLAFELLTDDEQRALVCLGLLPSSIFAPWELAACLPAEEVSAWTIVERLTQAGLVERTAADGTGVSRFHVLDRAYEYARDRAQHDLSRSQRSELLARYQSAVRARHRMRAVDDLHLRIYEIKDAGYLNEALDLARSALALAQDNQDTPALDLALATLAEINAELGNTPDVTGLSPARGDRGAQALARVRSLRYHGLAMRRQFRISRALQSFSSALDVLAKAELSRDVHRNELVRTLRERAIVYAFGENPLSGLADIQQIDALLAREPGLEQQHRAGVAWALGAIYDYADRHDDAEAAMQRGLAVAERAHQRLWQAWLLHGLARLALDNGDPRRCRADAGKSLELFSTMQHRYGTAHCRLLIGRAYARDGALPAASSALEETVETLSACDDVHLVALTSADLAGVRARQGRPADARRLWESALRVMDSLGDRAEGTLIRQQLQELEDGAPIEAPPAGAT
jgi:tetratricopeptide (TPR) repeat protein